MQPLSLFGLLAKIKYSICSYQLRNLYMPVSSCNTEIVIASSRVEIVSIKGGGTYKMLGTVSGT